MTSKENYQETITFFEEHHYFGYEKSAIQFFQQGELPLLTTEGKLVLNEQKQIKQAANGNGAIFEAMGREGVLDDMKKRRVEWIFIGSVDNLLVKMVDPILTGLALSQGTLLACKSVVKESPQERVGVFCMRNKKPSVIEYTELPKELAEKTDEQGNLVFAESHIMCNQFHISVLENLSQNSLPYHVAFKKGSYLRNDGNMVLPEEPNLYKFEAFIFDAFEQCKTMSILRVKREEEFAPVKNKEGNDSPQTAVKLYNEQVNKEEK